MRVWLNVPFPDKDRAKKLGARWCLANKRWFLENPADLSPFLEWIPGRLLKPHKQEKAAARDVDRYDNKSGKAKKVVEWQERLSGLGYICNRPSPWHLTYRSTGFNLDVWPTTEKFIGSDIGNGVGFDSLEEKLKTRYERM